MSCHSADLSIECLADPNLSGGLVNFGYTGHCLPGDPDGPLLMSYMRGTAGGSTRRPAGRAIGDGTGYTNRVVPTICAFKGIGDPWATLCPSPLGHPAFKASAMIYKDVDGETKKWRRVVTNMVSDTYLDVPNILATPAIEIVSYDDGDEHFLSAYPITQGARTYGYSTVSQQIYPPPTV